MLTSDSPAKPLPRNFGSTFWAGTVLMALMSATCLALALSHGAYQPADWLPYSLGLAALGIVVCLSGAAPAPFGRLRLVILGIFAAQAVWTTASMLWATGHADAWEEINRTLFYAVGMLLAAVAVRWAGRLGLWLLAGFVLAAITVMGLFLAIKLGVSADPTRYFSSSRLQYPISYFNGLAALLVLGFWLAIGMANGTGDERCTGHVAFLLRGLQAFLLAIAAFLVELAILPQSRGAFWTLILMTPFFVLLSPNRFRALAHLAIVALAMGVFWSRLNGVYASLHANQPIQPALNRALAGVGYSVLIVLVAWAGTWLVERSFSPLSHRVRRWIGVALIVVGVGAVAGGFVYADVQKGGIGQHLSQAWTELTSDRGTGDATASRFAVFGLNGRVQMWKVAIHAFEDHPILGLGAQNYEFYYYLNRTITLDVKQPHSQLLQLLGELGLPGLLLWLAFCFLAVATALVMRFRSSGRMHKAIASAVVMAVLSWFVHSSADWLWQMAAVSLPAMMLLGGLVAASALERPSRPDTRKKLPSWVPRSILALCALAVLVSAALPYLSIRYAQFASKTQDPAVASSRANVAASIDPTSTLPYASLASDYVLAADRLPADSPQRVTELKLAAEAWVKATKREPEGWLSYYQAAKMYLQARDAAAAMNSPSAAAFAVLAKTYLDQARRYNPLSPQIKALEEVQ
jgi:hypothetical protein